jgi:hypothetical protein
MRHQSDSKFDAVIERRVYTKNKGENSARSPIPISAG